MPDTVTITEIIDIVGADGRQISHREHSRVRIATVAAFGEDGAGPSVTKAPSADTIQDALERILDQDLSEPARPRRMVVLGGGVVPWRRERTIPGTNTVIITDAVDDAPATKMQVITDGRLVTTITQQWRRGPYSWDLVERDYSHGASHYTVKVKHSGSTTGMKTDSISPIFGHGINLESKPQSLSFFDNSLMAQDPCMGGSFEDPGACADKKQAWNDAKEDLLWSEAEVFAACALAPPPIDVPGCALATAHMLRNAQKRDKAKAAYEKCVSDYRVACDCEFETIIGVRPAPTLRSGAKKNRLLSPLALGSQLGNATLLPRSRKNDLASCQNFSPDPGDTDYSGSGGGGGYDTTYWMCYFYITYDSNGDITSYTFLGCEQIT